MSPPTTPPAGAYPLCAAGPPTLMTRRSILQAGTIIGWTMLTGAGLAGLAGCGQTPSPDSPATAKSSDTPGDPATPSSAASPPVDANTGTPDSPTPVTPTHPTPTTTPSPTSTASHVYGKKGIPRGQSGKDSKVKRTNATTVARVFVERLLELDARLDVNPNDGSRRAAVFATPAYRNILLSARPPGGPGAEFLELVQHDGYTISDTQVGGVGDGPADSTQVAYRIVTAKTRAAGDDGWKRKTTSATYKVALTRASKTKPWAVGGITLLP